MKLIVLIGSSLAALLLLSAPTMSVWGERHAPHDSPKTVRLSSGRTVSQTFVFEYKELDRVVLWLDATKSIPKEGYIQLEASTSSSKSASVIPLANIPSSGVVVFPLDSPLKASPDNTGTLSISLTNLKQRVELKFQIDATKYEGGRIVDDKKQGDLAFQLRYRRPALFQKSLQIAYALLIFAGGVIVAFSIKATKEKLVLKKPIEIIVPMLLFLAVTAFYGILLVKSGIWVGPSDFSKELSYVMSSAEAFKSFSWPIWSHYTCGGMPLLGNPEGTTLSLSTILAIVTSRPELGLWLTLAIEGGIAAAGAYCLARALRVSVAGSILVSFISSLSAVFSYKIVEGIVMVGGPFAFLPWALLGLHKAAKTRSPVWLLVSGLSLVAMFWRGDVHIIVGVFVTMLLWASWLAVKKRHLVPLLVLIGIFAVFLLGASVKTLPYLEQPELINSQVDPHSAQITKLRLWDDLFLKIHNRDYKIPVLHGLPEHYGYFGAYLGLLPIILAVTGLFSRHKYRWLVFIPLLVSLVLVDGALYENVLRHIGPLSALLRMPTRLLFISTLLIALLSGMGLDALFTLLRMRDKSSKQKLIASIVIVFVILLVLVNLVQSNNRMLKQNLSRHSLTKLDPADVPTLVPHQNESREDAFHASVLLESKRFLPHVCGDQNNPPEFLSQIDKPTVLSEYVTAVKPNTIILEGLPPNSEIAVRERFVSSWYSSSGQLLAGSDDSIHLITSDSPLNVIYLKYVSATIRAQQVLLVTIIALATIVIINIIHSVVLAIKSPHDY